MGGAAGALEGFDAILFDLDGVLTPTAKIHAAAWKEMFDDFLQQWSADKGVDEAPFDVESDYGRYVDGKPRVDGVRSFLESRGIELPEGEAADAPTAMTVNGLGNKKNVRVNELLERDGIEAYPGSLRLVNHLRERGVRIAVVSSSKNCSAVLEAAGIADEFDTQVDGNVATRLGLPGKPAPDTFLEAAKELGVPAAKAVVVEDALAGVQAGRAGDFGLVVGVDRLDQAEALAANGADVVVQDLAELLPERAA